MQLSNAFDFNQGQWINEPKTKQLSQGSLQLKTEPETDFWQRSYYGFRKADAPALLFNTQENFSFLVKVAFNYQALFDQAGVIIFIDDDNWFKASIEYENGTFSKLGSVVTNIGYSDWATTDIKTPEYIWYRLSRRGPDFRIEFSYDGDEFYQMRIFHLHALGETSAEMCQGDPSETTNLNIRFGVYACSPTASSFTATFSEAVLGECIWEHHQ